MEVMFLLHRWQATQSERTWHDYLYKSWGVSNAPIQFKSACKIWPLLELLAKIDQFRNIKIQPKIIDLSTRLSGINTEFVAFTPQSLVLRSIVLGWILIYRNWSIRRVLACSWSQNFCNCSHARILVKMGSIAPNFVNPASKSGNF